MVKSSPQESVKNKPHVFISETKLVLFPPTTVLAAMMSETHR